MTRTIPFALTLFALGWTLHFCTDCKPSPTTSAQAAAEGAYGAALLKCVDDAKTLAESKACRARVDAEWGVVQYAKDGGK
jgi:hypothetical protein